MFDARDGFLKAIKNSFSNLMPSFQALLKMDKSKLRAKIKPNFEHIFKHSLMGLEGKVPHPAV